MSNSYTTDGLFSHPSMVEEERETTVLRGLFSSRAELQSPVATKIRNRDTFVLRSATMQIIENTMAVVVGLVFQAVDGSITHAVSFFIQMAITDIVHHCLIEKLI